MQNQVFFGWYTAALTLAGRAAESIGHPALIGPLQNPDGKWFSVRGEERVIERPFFGSEEHPAWNLDQFVSKFRREEKRRGLDESVAFAVMSLLTDALSAMHSAHLKSPDGGLLSGIPHLNLRPENVLIGRDPRNFEYTVKVTDFLTATASPFAEKAGVKSPLNYSSRRVLEDSTCYGLDADIFSCGLLLFKLVENEYLIPAELSRRLIVQYIRHDFPRLLRNLRLTDASSRTLSIIQRCLTRNETERYSSVQELKQDIDRALMGKDASIIIRDYVERGGEADKVIGPRLPWRKIGLTVAILVFMAAVILVGKLLYDYIRTERLKSSIEIAHGATAKSWHDLKSSDCVSLRKRDSIGNDIADAERLKKNQDYQLASRAYAEIQSELVTLDSYCEKIGE